MPGKARLDWHDKRVQRDITNYLMRNSRAAGRFLAKEVRAVMGKRGESEPGQFPGRRTGRTQKSIRHEARRSRSRGTISIRVGASKRSRRAHILRFLEEGTKRMAARPALFPIFKRLARRMAEIVLKGNR